MEPVIIAIITALLAGAVWVLRSTPSKQESLELPNKPFPDEWRKILSDGWPIYRRLPEELKNELEQLTLVFLDRIEFRGVEGLKVTDEIRVLTAAQACLLLLNQGTFFTNKLKSVVMYPKAYKATTRDSFGAESAERQIAVQGQSWENGLVALSWDNTHTGAANTRDGRNLVLHEFAHQLDQADGLADGAPALGSKEQYRRWQTVCSRVFADLQDKVDRGQKTVIDEYGATNPAEFFSVATETFFEKPSQLNKKRPELYKLLREYYRVDPLTW